MDDISEGEALSDFLDEWTDWDSDDWLGNKRRMEATQLLHGARRRTLTIQSAGSLKPFYDAAKSAKTGETISCPVCKKQFVKRSYQQAFCSNKGKSNCKDKYWNQSTPERLERALAFSKDR